MARKRRRKFLKQNIVNYAVWAVFLFASFMFLLNLYGDWKDNRQQVQKREREIISWAVITGEPVRLPFAGVEEIFQDPSVAAVMAEHQSTPVILPEYIDLYHQNNDLIGWLSIEDTVIDYPVMQCIEDENYYLSHDFYREENKNGCLILDNDSVAGVGTRRQNYENGTRPSTNLIIHGHTMKSGQMFGSLRLYEDEEYGMSHSTICFDSLYERREYELIAVFYSQIFYENEDVFKYYKFFQADTREAFDDWYSNIKELSLYDTGVTAEFGDEFITLSCCAYHVENGRFVVVGKRVR
ncbi:MAG: class B sortase [Lachnospiraceae bacterium]